MLPLHFLSRLILFSFLCFIVLLDRRLIPLSSGSFTSDPIFREYTWPDAGSDVSYLSLCPRPIDIYVSPDRFNFSSSRLTPPLLVSCRPMTSTPREEINNTASLFQFPLNGFESPRRLANYSDCPSPVSLLFLPASLAPDSGSILLLCSQPLPSLLLIDSLGVLTRILDLSSGAGSSCLSPASALLDPSESRPGRLIFTCRSTSPRSNFSFLEVHLVWLPGSGLTVNSVRGHDLLSGCSDPVSVFPLPEPDEAFRSRTSPYPFDLSHWGDIRQNNNNLVNTSSHFILLCRSPSPAPCAFRYSASSASLVPLTAPYECSGSLL